MKAAVVYYSNSGVTEELAKRAGEKLGCEIFCVKPKESYGKYLPAIWRSFKEKLFKKIPEYEAPGLDPSEYDLVLIGYPIWYGSLPDFFADCLGKLDFSGKRVAPFATSGGSSVESTLEGLKKAVKGAELTEAYGYNTKKEKPDFDAWLERIKA